MEPGLYVVATPIGNLADLSARAGQTLREASVVYAEDTRRTGRLLKHIGSSRPLRSLHAHNEAQRVAEVLNRISAGEACALVTDAGTPVLSDPGSRLVKAVTAAGRKVSPIPGPSAIAAAASIAGLGADRFAFLGFAPRRGSRRQEWLTDAAESKVTVVFFESPRRLAVVLRDLEEKGLGERRVVVCREMTKLHEEVRGGTVAELAGYYAQAEVRGEVTVVLEGSVAGGDDGESGVDEAELEATADELSASGLRPSAVAAELRQLYGISRNDAYQLSLRVKDRS